ncbi:hypothetical protein OAZ24_02935 [Synechococcus sp. AH-736-G21]|nr:hypothetical protein [Synechococcus sp. AH-736-G21]MDC3011169.1 hypothetical protein [Synechococcus sp. AH-736-G21]
MQRLIQLLCLGVASLGLSSCGLVSPGSDSPNADSSASLKQLERRLTQLEQELEQLRDPADDADSKTPAGPLRSLTLRIGTEDDRLRMYWADGQTSDLICSQEGNGVWACG